MYGKPLEDILDLLQANNRESICIDKNPGAEYVLRLILDKNNVLPSEEMHIHCWSIKTEATLDFWFVDDLQNSIIKQGFSTVCSV